MSAATTYSELVAAGQDELRSSGIECCSLESQLLLAWALGTDRLEVLTRPDTPVSLEHRDSFLAAVRRRASRVPFAYIRGSQEFYGLEFTVSPSVLIPRPETEQLVEFAMERCASGEEMIWDVGTGSGCLGVTIAAKNPRACVIASDISAEALEVAAQNARRHRASVSFTRADLLECAREESVTTIVSNPPYIGIAELESLQPEVKTHEPRIALAAGERGMSIFERLIPQAHFALRRRGWLAVEVGAGQSRQVADLFANSGFSHVEAKKDLAGIERVVIGRKA